MSKEDFISSELLEKNIVNRKKDTIGEKINWLNVREIKMDKNHPYSIFMIRMRLLKLTLNPNKKPSRQIRYLA